jgi:hypothetical protein
MQKMVLKSIKIFIILTFTFCGIVRISNAQTVWAPVGAKWTYLTQDYENDEWILTFFTSAKDTLVLDKICKKIDINRLSYDINSHNQDSSYKGYYLMYSENEKVYYFFNDTFRLLYDFSLNKGDTLYSYQPTFDSNVALNRYVIDSINYIQITGKLIKRQYLHTIDSTQLSDNRYFFLSGDILEGIGNTTYMFGETFYTFDVFGPYLKCYSDSEISYSVTNCDSLISINESDQSQRIQIYPNPTLDEIILNYSGHQPFDIEIINSLGVKMMEQNKLSSDMNPINVEALESGIYFLVLKGDKIRLVRKFIKY